MAEKERRGGRRYGLKERRSGRRYWLKKRRDREGRGRWSARYRQERWKQREESD